MAQKKFEFKVSPNDKVFRADGAGIVPDEVHGVLASSVDENGTVRDIQTISLKSDINKTYLPSQIFATVEEAKAELLKNLEAMKSTVATSADTKKQ